MRVLGLDIGQKRVGVAVSDPQMNVATPVVVLEGDLLADVRPLRRLVEDYEAAAIIVGLPLSLSGEEGPQAIRVREQALRVGEILGLRVFFFDERLSSAEARKMMHESGLTERQQRGSVDMVAAGLILQSYLDSGGPARDGIAPDE